MKKKKCSVCGKLKSLDGYYKQPHGKDGLRADCKACVKVYEEKRKSAPGYRYKKWKQELNNNYGLSVKAFNTLSKKQRNVCALCRGAPAMGRKTVKNLYVDHCHVTGKIRGLLCSYCNAGLGLFKDNVDALQRAVKYLKGKL